MDLLRVTIIWFGFSILAFANGTLREFGIKKFIGEPWAHHLSVFTCIALFTIYLFYVWKHTEIHSYKTAVSVGVYWIVLTVLFETFLIGRLMSKMDWSAIFETYDLRKSLWSIVVIWVGLLPSLMLWIKNR